MMRAAVNDLFARTAAGVGSSTGLLVETLLDGGADADVAKPSRDERFAGRRPTTV